MLPVHTIEERRKSCFLLKDFVNCWSANNTREAESLACESFKIRAFYCFVFFKSSQLEDIKLGGAKSFTAFKTECCILV